MTAPAHTFPAGPTLEALRVQRDSHAASEGEAAVIYDKLRDELVLARRRFSDQGKQLATARLDLRAAHRRTRARPWSNRRDPADRTEAVYKELDETKQQTRAVCGAR
jgi:hypothetical protein